VEEEEDGEPWDCGNPHTRSREDALKKISEKERQIVVVKASKKRMVTWTYAKTGNEEEKDYFEGVPGKRCK
jgi:hypothetical protein